MLPMVKRCILPVSGSPQSAMLNIVYETTMSLEINITQIEASMMVFALVMLISQFLENCMFSIEMDTRM